jgi:hypothetical protein
MRIWLDDERPAPAGFMHAKTAREAIKAIEAGLVTEVSLDHDLGEGNFQGSGYEVAEFIEEAAYFGRIKRIKWAVHSMNPIGAKRMRAALSKADKYWGDHEQEGEKDDP